MELLAPAGSKESFIAALRGGADAVYCGVENYNARIAADRFNFYDLAVFTDYAHTHARKLYLTLNILIKQGELPDILRKLEVIARIKPDGIIVQDTGVARLIHTYFPEIPLHASTQMAVHNKQGLAMLKKLGFSRAVLARELSLAELKIMAHKPPVEMELFCHGALCFCVSGMCLFSSALGALSGNRGRCLQPCRRIWTNGKRQGYFLSPKDLQLAGQIPLLKELGVSALKIEGRMRSSEYVYRVSAAYRLLLDAPAHDYAAALKDATAILSNDYAREKTTALFLGRENTIFSPFTAQCLGKKIGSVASSCGGTTTITASEPLNKGDRIRIVNPHTDTTKTLVIKDVTRTEDRYTFATDHCYENGIPVFKAGDGAWDTKSIEAGVNALYREYAKAHSERDHAVAPAGRHPKAEMRLKTKQPPPAAPGLWITIDTPDWLDHLPQDDTTLLIFSLNRENMHAFRNVLEHLPFSAGHAACALIPYISQREIPEYTHLIDLMTAAGIRKWVLNNIAHIELFSGRDVELIAGPFLYAWNIQALLSLIEAGITRSITSWEDDYPNIKKLADAGAAERLVPCLFGYPPLVRSRLLSPEGFESPDIARKKDMDMSLVFQSGAGILIPKAPVILFAEKERLTKCGIRHFGIDLSFTDPDPRFWHTLQNAFTGKIRLPAGFTFNFNRGIV